MVDMAFITQLTGLTDKLGFYRLIRDGAFPAPIKLGPQLPLAEK
ncbi:putative regulatory protein [Escherichia coli]|uniref:Putative regulatory protein n=1 Tax=Escherichia coli TaxID=562 RepID=A0A2X1JB33_ECOLX|nr:putative regulatory protein [Escherichia coli]